MKHIEKMVVVVLFSALVLLCFLQIVFRFALNFSLSWTEELARYVFILLVYMSACAAVLHNAHVRVEIIDGLLPERFKKTLDTVVDLLFMVFMALIGYYGIHLSQESFEINQLSPAMQIPMGAVYAIIPITFFLTSGRLIQRIVLRYRPRPAEEAA
ncbi:MAG: TRAP transporter small permease [Verrucomicrobiota bacterium]